MAYERSERFELHDEAETEVCCTSPTRLLLCFPKVSRVAVIVGCANIAGQMNYNAIIIALLMLSKSGDTVPSWATSASSSVMFLGSIFGQLVLGFYGDTVGRMTALVASLLLMALGSLASAIVWNCVAETKATIYIIVIVARFFAGVGVGGTYPLSAVAAFENTASGSGRLEALVRASWALFWQVPGQIFIYLLAGLLAVSPGLGWTTKARLVMASGAVPALLALPWAVALACHDTPSSINKRAQLKLLFSMPLALRKLLLGCSLSWFLFDIYAYGVTVYAADIAEWIFNGKLGVAKDAWYNAIGSTVGLPSILSTIFLLSYTKDVGRLQILGFITAAAFSCATGAAWFAGSSSDLLAAVFLALRAAIVFGTALTTFIAPAFLFPPRLRSTCNGIAAATGKFGGLLGTYGFGLVAKATGPPALFFLLAFIATLGAFVTALLLYPVTFGPADTVRLTEKVALAVDREYNRHLSLHQTRSGVPEESSHLLSSSDRHDDDAEESDVQTTKQPTMPLL